MGDFFVEVDHAQRSKHNKQVPGDVFLSRKTAAGNRIVSVLADGLGSGIKANVLATLTTTISVNLTSNSVDIKNTAETIMKTLPECKERKISYSTFTIIDIDLRNNRVKIMEFDNPGFMLFRNEERLALDKKKIRMDNPIGTSQTLYYSQFTIELGDRLVVYSDGVSQAGIGRENFSLGWSEEEIVSTVKNRISKTADISARELSNFLVNKAYEIDGNKAKDDITGACFYFRRPRRTLLVTGPPVDKSDDYKIKRAVDQFQGKKIICGGTTSQIYARLAEKDINVNLESTNKDIPPDSEIAGIDLVTEGMLTMSRAIELLESEGPGEIDPDHPGHKLYNMIKDSDYIKFVVGTKINEVHQNPNIPEDLGLRKNVVKKISDLLREKYLKKVDVEYI
ncbi:MAG: SpoIIE family protein phosphatase [bacterium]